MTTAMVDRRMWGRIMKAAVEAHQPTQRTVSQTDHWKRQPRVSKGLRDQKTERTNPEKVDTPDVGVLLEAVTSGEPDDSRDPEELQTRTDLSRSAHSKPVSRAALKATHSKNGHNEDEPSSDDGPGDEKVIHPAEPVGASVALCELEVLHAMTFADVKPT
jgi:hypothetical protein